MKNNNNKLNEKGRKRALEWIEKWIKELENNKTSNNKNKLFWIEGKM
ncbi:hypothetical protein [Anaerobacillus alkalidiazotrophicus]|nr:hypothetical protein [Anaerobacillus alkalidiazotrophicus]